MARLLLLSPLVLLMAACAGSGTTTDTASGYPPLESSQVTVYNSEKDVPGEFEVVSFLQPPQQTGYSASSSQTEEMRRQAARLGANGLLLIDENSEVADARISAALSQRGSYNRTQYVAIFVGETPAEPAR